MRRFTVVVGKCISAYVYECDKEWDGHWRIQEYG